MHQIARAKATNKALESCIITSKSSANGKDRSDKVDFALAFYMAHEVLMQKIFLKEVAVLKSTGNLPYR